MAVNFLVYKKNVLLFADSQTVDHDSATYNELLLRAFAKHKKYSALNAANVHMEIRTDTAVYFVKGADVAQLNASVVVQTAKCRKVVITAYNAKSNQELPQITSRLTNALSKTDQLQHLLAHIVQTADKGPMSEIYLLFATPKLLHTLQLCVAQFFGDVHAAQATSKDAARILKTPTHVSHNVSDDERMMRIATLNKCLPYSPVFSKVVELDDDVTAAYRAVHQNCTRCSGSHFTHCNTCKITPKCGTSSFLTWLKTDAYICIGCAQTVCQSCVLLRLHRCSAVQSELNFRFLARPVEYVHAKGQNPLELRLPEWFLNVNLPEIGTDGIVLQQVAVTHAAMSSFAKFESECRHVLLQPGQWAVGVDATNEAQRFFAIYGVDKRYIAVADLEDEMFAQHVQNQEYVHILKCLLQARKPTIGKLCFKWGEVGRR